MKTIVQNEQTTPNEIRFQIRIMNTHFFNNTNKYENNCNAKSCAILSKYEAQYPLK